MCCYKLMLSSSICILENFSYNFKLSHLHITLSHCKILHSISSPQNHIIIIILAFILCGQNGVLKLVVTEEHPNWPFLAVADISGGSEMCCH